VGVGRARRQTLQTEAFRFSTDPGLEASVRDVVGLSLEPSAHTIVLCVDETSQIQALPRADAAGGQRRRGGAKAGCAPATHRAVEGVADDRLGGGAAGLSTPQEVMPVKRSCTAVRPPVRRGRPGSWLPRTTKGSLEQ
jgi:hypothetical protein